MTYEEIWQKIKVMSQRNKKMLAYELSLSLGSTHEDRQTVGYIHSHYYFDAKAIHNILFYPPERQNEINDENGKYFNALKEIVENDKEIHVNIKRHKWLPRFVNDWHDGKVVKSYISSRFNYDALNSWYRILPGKSLAGERPRSMFIWDGDGGEVVYKMTACNVKDGREQMTFERMDK